MGVSVVRTHNFQPGYAWDEENKCWDWDSEYMTGFYKYADIMKENNIDIIINTTEGFCSSSRIGEPIVPVDAELPSKDFDSNGITKESLDYNSACADIYADWTVQFVKEVIIKRGYSNIKYFMYATEPGGNVETFEQNEYSFQLYLMYLKASDEALKNAGLRNMVKFVGPNVASYPNRPTDNITEKAKLWLNLSVQYANDYLDIYSIHRYIKTNSFISDYYSVWKEYVEYAKSIISLTGKPYWFDEWNFVADGGSYADTAADPFKATQIALAQISMMSSGADLSIVWYLTDIKFPNSERNSNNGESYRNGIHLAGLQPSILESTVPYPSYYVFCMLGSAIKQGDIVYASTNNNGIYSILLKHLEGTYSIVCVSMEKYDKSITYNLPDDIQNISFSKTVYNPYEFSVDENATPIESSSIINTENDFSDIVGPYQVVVYNQQ